MPNLNFADLEALFFLISSKSGLNIFFFWFSNKKFLSFLTGKYLEELGLAEE